MRHPTLIVVLALVLGGAALAPAPAAALLWQEKVDPAVLGAAAAGPVEMIALLAEQADLSGAAAVAGKEAKGAWVYEQLTAVAAATQPPVLAALDRLGAPHRGFWIVNAVWARGGLAVVEALAARPDVAHVYASGTGFLDPPVEPAAGMTPPAAWRAAESVEWNLAQVRAPEVWALGYQGQGVVVAGADSGVEWTHPALQGRYRGWDGATADHDYNWHLGATPNYECPDPDVPCDDDAFFGGGHGSHTMGTMVGDDGLGNQIGMAPGARWIACRNMNFGVGAVPFYLDCMEWFLAPTDLAGENPDPAKAPHVVNNSWACAEACPQPLLKAQLEASRAAGIVYVVSAGNFGPACSTIVFPLATYEGAFTVGATDDADGITGFSSRGPVLLDPPELPHRGPDVAAPGDDVRSALRGGTYGSLDGTSMAGPHVAGLVALMLSANPALAGEVDRIEEIITQTTLQLTTTEGCGGDTADQVPNNTFGWGRIDALAAVEMALREPRPCTVIDDADPAVEYRRGWHRRTDPRASGGGFHRRMGSAGGVGSGPTARVVFEGGSVTYHLAKSEIGGKADVYLDGVLVESIDYHADETDDDGDDDGDGDGDDEDLRFGFSRTWDGLGPGSHELLLRHRSGAVYVDGFAFDCDQGEGADPSAAGFRSVTEVDTATAAEGPVITRSLAVGPADEAVSVVVAGSPVPLTVQLLSPTGALLAQGGSLLGGFAASGVDAAVSQPGTYTVVVASPPGAFESIEISTARTVRLD